MSAVISPDKPGKLSQPCITDLGGPKTAITPAQESHLYAIEPKITMLVCME